MRGSQNLESEHVKAVIKPQPGVGVKFAEVPEPVAAEGEVLVRVEATSICGSDLAIYEWRDWVAARMKTPRVVGHEFCGTIVALGAGVETLQVGQFIAAETHIVDGTCHQCLVGERHVCENVQIIGFDRDGCFAELIAIPAANAWVTDRAMPLEVASIQEPFGNAVRAAAGAPIDVVLEMSGNPAAIDDALHALRPGGWISLLGLPSRPVSLDLNGLVIQKGITLHGVFGRRIWQTWEETRRYLGSGLVDVRPLITHRIALDDVEDAMELLRHGESGKVVMFPGGVPVQ